MSFFSEFALRIPSSSGFFLDGNIHLECHFYWAGASSAVGFRLFVWDLWAFFIFMRVRLLAVLANISVFLEWEVGILRLYVLDVSKSTLQQLPVRLLMFCVQEVRSSSWCMFRILLFSMLSSLVLCFITINCSIYIVILLKKLEVVYWKLTLCQKKWKQRMLFPSFLFLTILLCGQACLI